MNAGIPEATRQLTVSFRYNDFASVAALFDRHPGQIAGLILEARAATIRRAVSCTRLQRLCHAQRRAAHPRRDDHRFPLARRRRAEVYNIVPDLTCFGKALANGFSVSALAGKREFMRLGGLDHTDKPRVFLLSTTHGAETHALAAAIATMRIYKSEPVIEHLYEQGRKLREGLTEGAAHHGLSDHFKVLGRDCCLTLATLDERAPAVAVVPHPVPAGDDPPRRADAVAGGQLHPRRCRISQTIDAVSETLGVYAQALESGVGRFLVGRPSQIVYRRYNEPAEPAPLAVAGAR